MVNIIEKHIYITIKLTEIKLLAYLNNIGNNFNYRMRLLSIVLKQQTRLSN